jgi:hypothetical protein
MARNYPRFLYSNPENTKSKGPFIVHTLEPRVILKICTQKEYDNCKKNAAFFNHSVMEGIICLDKLNLSEEKETQLLSEAFTWYRYQVEDNQINR